MRREPGTRLRKWVKEALGELREPDIIQTEMAAVVKADELPEADPLDSSHPFFEELRRIGRALREMRPEELTDEDVNELMPALDHVSVALMQIERRRQRRQDGLKSSGFKALLRRKKLSSVPASLFRFSHLRTYDPRLSKRHTPDHMPLCWPEINRKLLLQISHHGPVVHQCRYDINLLL